MRTKVREDRSKKKRLVTTLTYETQETRIKKRSGQEKKRKNHRKRKLPEAGDIKRQKHL